MLRVDFGFGLELDRDGVALSTECKTLGLAQVRGSAMNLFGGCTLTHTQGDWQCPESGVLYSERGATLSVLTEWNPQTEDKMKQLAEDIKRSLKQKAVYVTQFHVHATLY